MTRKNKMLLLAVGAALAVSAWYFLQPAGVNAVEPAVPVATKSAAVPSHPVPTSAAPPAQTAAQLNPYGDYCPTIAQPVAMQGSLADQLLPLLQSGKTPAELLQYDLTPSVWYIQYANTIAEVMQQRAAQVLNIQHGNFLEMLVIRQQQEQNDNPLQVARELAADENFQVFTPHLGTIHGSSLLSPSLMFLQLSAKVPADEFNKLIAGKTFSPLEIAVALELQLPETHLLQLVAQGRDLAEFPVGYSNQHTGTPAWNLADVAATQWQPKVLKALKQQGVVPSSIEGVVTGLDFALFSKPSRSLDLSNQPELQQRLKQAQRNTVAYLLNEGYWAHGYQSENGIWRFGNHFLNAINFDGKDILALLPSEHVSAAQAASVFRRLNVKPQPIPAGTALANWVQAHKQAGTLAKQAKQQCHAGKQQLIAQEGLLSRELIQDHIFKLRAGQPGAAMALAPLHQQDPAWVAWHWQLGGAPEGDTNEQLRDQISQRMEDQAELAAFLQKTELDSNTTAWLLMELVRQPSLLQAFNQRFAPKAPTFLYSLFSSDPLSAQHQAELKALTEAGYDFALQDLYGRNLFQWAFLASPQAVLFMLQQGVSPFAPALGPDALDMALEASYLQRQLHPALPQILAQLKDPEPSHLARLKRLELYRPDVYQAVLALKPDLQLPPDTKPNELLSPLM